MNDSFFSVCVLAEVLLLAGIIYTAIRPSMWRWRTLYLAAFCTTAAFVYYYSHGLSARQWSYERFLSGIHEMQFLLYSMAGILTALAITKALKRDVSTYKFRKEAVQAVVGTASNVLALLLIRLVPTNKFGVVDGFWISTFFMSVVVIFVYEFIGGCSPKYTFLGSCVSSFLVMFGITGIAAFYGSGFTFILTFVVLIVAPLLQVAVLGSAQKIVEHRINQRDATPESPEQT